MIWLSSVLYCSDLVFFQGKSLSHVGQWPRASRATGLLSVSPTLPLPGTPPRLAAFRCSLHGFLALLFAPIRTVFPYLACHHLLSRSPSSPCPTSAPSLSVSEETATFPFSEGLVNLASAGRKDCSSYQIQKIEGNYY